MACPHVIEHPRTAQRIRKFADGTTKTDTVPVTPLNECKLMNAALGWSHGFSPEFCADCQKAGAPHVKDNAPMRWMILGRLVMRATKQFSRVFAGDTTQDRRRYFAQARALNREQADQWVVDDVLHGRAKEADALEVVSDESR